MNELLCGSACVNYVLEAKKIKPKVLNRQMTWITELALALKNNNINNIEIKYYDSNLYNDYLTGEYNHKFSGFKYLEEAIKNKIIIKEEKLDKKTLTNELAQCDFIIMCVESRIFNNDHSMTGGHFIILTQEIECLVKIINPVKNKYEYKMCSKEEIISFCVNYGSWRILIKEDIHD